MAGGRKRGSDKAGGPLFLSKTDAARALRVNPSTLYRYLKELPSAVNKDDKVDIAKVIEFIGAKDLERRIEAIASGDDDNIVRMAKISRARRQILQDQAFDGRTIFHDDAVRLFDNVAREFLKEVNRWPRSFAPVFAAYVADHLSEVANANPHLREHLSIDIADFELWFKEQQRRRIEHLGTRLADIIPEATEAAKAQA